MAEPWTSVSAAAFAGAPVPGGAAGADQHVAYARSVCSRDAGLAAQHLYEALRIDPAHAPAHGLLARYLYEVRMLPEALEHSRPAAEALPHDTEIAANHLLVLEALDLTEEAMELLSHHVDSGGQLHPDLAIMFGRIAHRAKREEEGVRLMEGALRSRSISPVQRKALHMHAGWLLDRLGRYDEAFEQVRLGHAANPAPFPLGPFRENLRRQAKWFSAESVQSLPRATHGWTQPLFIVGMPRSGTSLVEQILDAHPAVTGAGELVEMSRVVSQIESRSGGTYPSFLASATPEELDGVAGLYLSRVAALAPHARYIVDKQVFNWMNLGVIDRLFPAAHVIHVVRDPRDTCLSCYMTPMNQEMIDVTDLRHLGIHFADHLMFMAHWRRVLDLPILELSYESLVADPEAQVRRMLSFLDLPWDSRCLDFHQNTRSVITASMQQVRKPMYSSSVGRWKNYERHLGPLIEVLGSS